MVAMSRLARLVALVATLSAAALTPGGALGHGAGVPWIYVEQEQVWPGQPFHVLVLDVAPYVTVELVAELSGTRVSLGSIATGALGHGEADMTLPADFPFGYAQLIGRGDDGSELTTALRVGDVPPTSLPIGPPPAQPPAQPQASPSPLSDPSVWTLGLLLGGGAVALGWRALRRRSSAPAGVPVEVAGKRAPRPRKARARRR